jgi:hypothetical protein
MDDKKGTMYFIEEPKLNDISEIPEVTGVSFVEEATGKLLQGGAAQSHELVFRCVPADATDAIKAQYSARYRSEGWGLVGGVVVPALPGAQVWAINRERFAILQARKHQPHTGENPDVDGAFRISRPKNLNATRTVRVKAPVDSE